MTGDVAAVILAIAVALLGVLASSTVNLAGRLQLEGAEKDTYIDFLEYRIQKVEEELAEAYETMDDIWNRGRAN